MEQVPVKKNKEYMVDIIDSGYEGEGIAKIDNYTIFIPGAIKGEKIKILIVKVLVSHAFGKIVEILEESQSRIESDCTSYKRCGGCNLRHIRYEDTLLLKQSIVQNLVNKTLKNKITVKDTIGMENPYNYRNKVQFPIGHNKKNELAIGVYANRTHEIVPITACFIQDITSQKIAKYVVAFMKKNKIPAYNEITKKGIVRHVGIRFGLKTNEYMCIIVTNGNKFPNETELVEELIANFKEIKTIVKNVNNKDTNIILGQKNITLYGEGHIYDKLGEYTFEISPLSFYQINPIQTEKLYDKAIELAQLSKDDIAMDLYCGIGTIGIFLAKHVKKVYGVEIIEQAIENAKRNAQINNIDNIEFFCGDVEKILKNLIEEEKINPDIIFLDPPRKGLDNITIKNILEVQPKKVIYISCNPATLVRDLKILEEKYNVKEIQTLDMFPFTNHVECVVVLGRKENLES